MLGNNLDFQALRTGKTIIYVAINEADLSEYNLLLKLFFDDLFRFLLATGENDNDRFVGILYDDAGTFQIPNLANFLAVSRKHKVCSYLLLQDLQQLAHWYGNYESQTIINGCIGTKLFISGMDSENDLRTIIHLVGSHEGKPVITADALRRMKDKVLISTPGERVILSEAKPYFKNKVLLKRSKISPPNLKFQTVNYQDFKLDGTKIQQIKRR